MLAALAVTDVQPESRPLADAAEEHKAMMARIAEFGDRTAFKALFLHFGPRLKSFMMKSGASAAQAEDLVQDVMLTVWRKVHLYSADRGSVSGWIFTIARNLRIDRLRAGSSQPYEDLETIEIAGEEPSGEDVTLAGQRAERVAAALAGLPDEQREVIHMAFVEDIPQSAIAARLDLPLGTVKSRMRLAYSKLKVQLEGLQ